MSAADRRAREASAARMFAALGLWPADADEPEKPVDRSAARANAGNAALWAERHVYDRVVQPMLENVVARRWQMHGRLPSRALAVRARGSSRASGASRGARRVRSTA